MDAAAGHDAKAELRSVMRRRRRELDDTERRARRIWDGVVALPAVGRSGRVMVFTSIAGEPDTEPFLQWCAEQGKETLLPEDHPDPTWPDVVIVPGLAFTRTGHRLGHGGGWYDRFLADRRPDCVTIGVAFDVQLVESLPVEGHDVQVDHVVTDA